MTGARRPGRGSGARFALRLARREARTALRRVGVFAASIALGVGALVAIHAFREDVTRALDQQSLALMGSDARLGGSAPLSETLEAVVDSLEAAGTETARVTTALSMVLAPASDRVRLLQVKGVEGAWPFYGEPRTRPGGRWSEHLREGRALVDPAVLLQLDAAVGDTLAIGATRVRIVGVAEELPTDLGFQAAVGPRVWISAAELGAAELLGVGSLARYETHFRFPAEGDAGTVWTRYAELFRDPGVEYTTAGEQARRFTDALDFLGRYLGLLGLGALLLGSVGVAGAVHVYVRSRVTDVAVLRCIGATQGTTFLAFLVQATGLGLVGSVAGVGVGLAAQAVLPRVLAGVLPVRVDPAVSPAVVGWGLALGVAVAVLFALPPLLSVRDVPPLRALRRDVDSAGSAGARALRVVVYGMVAVAVAGLAVLQAGSVRDGLAFAAGLVAVVACLRVVGGAMVGAARRWVPRGAPYTLRQGVSNLFRPRNQTISVTLALGFGVFVVGTVLQVQASLSSRFTLEGGAAAPDVILFDIQPDQLDGVLALLPPDAEATATPVVPARIAAIGGRTTDELLTGDGDARAERWALRREYRNTYRAELTGTEEVVEGVWFGEGDAVAGDPSGPAEISMEVDLAADLGVGLGDSITWNVAGRLVPSVVTSLRRVDWEQFATNFFVVFEPGVLEAAPRQSVVLARVGDEERRAELLGELVRRYPNVSALDVGRVRETVEALVARIDAASAFLALFCALAGLAVLAGALAASRRERLAEAALLRTLGARRGQVARVLLFEYVALGTVAGATGLALAFLASWLLVSRVFGIPWVPSAGAALAVWLGVTLLTVVVGALGSRGVTTRPPLPVLREADG